MTSMGSPAAVSDSGASNPLEDRFDSIEGAVHLSGIQALVRLPMDQRRLDARNGLDTSVLVSGYEGSPLAGLDLQLAKQKRRLDAHKVVFRPGLNEELAANVVQGSQLASASPELVGDGVVGIWYGKAPGLDRATDAIRHSNLAGTARNGGVLALVGDDSTAKSSTVPSSSEPAIAELSMPCLSPADPQEILELGLHGIAMSRACGLWVALKLATNVVDGSGTVDLGRANVRPTEPDLTFDGTEFTHEVTGSLLQPNLGRLERTQVTERLEIARRYAAANNLDRIDGDESATLGIVAAGASYLDVRQALSAMGISTSHLANSGVRILKLGMIHPLDPKIVHKFADGLTEIVVVEEKKAFIELALKDVLYGTKDAPRIVGKRDESGHQLFRADADLPADYIAARIAPRIVRHGGASTAADWIAQQASARRPPVMLPILPRQPYFCSGCPHNRSTRVPDGSLVGAGIGCHGMVEFLPDERTGTTIGLTQMGGEGATWIGMAPFVSRNHLIQNLGDGTFHHSGSLAIRASIASRTNITYKLLYNDAVAMTGGQQAIGKMAVPEIVTTLLAEGVARIVITSDDPKSSRKAFGRRLPDRVSIRDRDDLIAAQEELAAVKGVTILIHQQECATELRRKRKRGLVDAPKERIVINERVCEGCGDCGDKSNCLSVQPVETEFGRKTQIHQASCNLDFSCIKGDCPSFVEVIPGKKVKAAKTERAKKTERVDVSTLPAPMVKVSTEDFSMRVTGVGGTGVVTVSQVLAAAANKAGLSVVGLDQLGLAQKGGAVVSDIRMSSTPIVGANKIGPGDCDLYLGCDILVAAAEANVKVIAADHTISVVSTSVTPTGKMVTDINATFPDERALVDRIEWAGTRPENVFVDARRATATALGDDQYANIFLLGVAVQTGALPLAPEDVEWALDLNGVQVQRNIEAFRLGRQYVSRPSALPDETPAPTVSRRRARAAAAIVRATKGGALESSVARRVDELVAFQNERCAQEYATEVEAVRRREEKVLGTEDISDAYAKNLFKVMAYKDEYEVARLHLATTFSDGIRDQFGADARYSFLLHPPILRAMGMDRKIRMNARWARLAFAILYMMRRVRGTRLDVFGYSAVRRAERALIEDYRSAMHDATDQLAAGNAHMVQEIAQLPDMVRGYEEIKLRSLEAYQVRRSELLDAIASSIREG